MLSAWSEGFVSSAQALWGGFVSFVPTLILALVSVILGVLIGKLFGKAVAQVVSLLNIDKLIEKAGAEKYFARAGIKVNVGGFVGALVSWFVIVVFVVEALNQLHLTEVTKFLQHILMYLPNVFVAVFVLFTGLLIGEFVDRIVVGATRVTQIGKSKLLGTASRWAVWLFAGLVALYQLGIAAVLSEAILNSLAIGIAIAVGLAFGLGGQQHASDLIQKIRDEASDK